MLVDPARVTGPARLAPTTLLLISEPKVFGAPTPVTPAPVRVTGSAPIAWPFKSSAAPEETTVAPATLPRALLLPRITLPLLILNAPVKVFVPFRVRLSGPTLSQAEAATLS